MNDSHDQRTVESRFIDNDESPFNEKTGGFAELRASNSQSRLKGRKMELIKQPLQEVVGRVFIVGRDIAPNLPQIALRAGCQAIFSHGRKGLLSDLGETATDRSLHLRRWPFLQNRLA